MNRLDFGSLTIIEALRKGLRNCNENGIYDSQILSNYLPRLTHATEIVNVYIVKMPMCIETDFDAICEMPDKSGR